MSTANDTTLHCVYRIVCFATGKSYVGQTNNLIRRKYEHFPILEKGQHYNGKLQRAYKKYGAQSFFLEVLEDQIKHEDINGREIWWIAHFDSRTNGYNITEGGHIYRKNRGKHCEWNGIHYESISDAADANGVSPRLMSERLLNGNTCDSDLYYGMPCKWNNIEYKTISEAAKANGISKTAMCIRLKNGMICDADLQSNQHCYWNGIRYNSIKEAAIANGMSKPGMVHRLNQGYTCDSDLPDRNAQARRACVWNKKEYSSKLEAAKENNISIGSMYYYYSRGYTCDEDVLNKTSK